MDIACAARKRPDLLTLAMMAINRSAEGDYYVGRLRKRSDVMKLLSLAVIPVLFAIATLAEHERRLQVLQHGERVQALVTRSGNFGYKNLCRVAYNFAWQGHLYGGELVGCDHMQRYPKGSSIEVRLNPNDPANSLAEGNGVWPSYTIVPVLFAVFSTFIVSSLAVARVRKNTLSRSYVR